MRIIEKIRNWILKIKAIAAYNREVTDIAIPPNQYMQVFVDRFHQPLKKNWRMGQKWGDFHPDNLKQHYDLTGNQAYINDDTNLVLKTQYSPKKYVKADLPEWKQTPTMPDKFTIPYAVGLVTSYKSWKYGWFEAGIKLPKGANLWPAFWLGGTNSWPPEIDIFEGYTDQGPYYEKNRWLARTKKWWMIEPNVHYTTDKGKNRMTGAYDVPVYRATERFVQYVCWWEKDFIRIYYNGRMVFETKDKKVLSTFNKAHAFQQIILNNAIIWEEGYPPSESKMEVKYVKVYQK